MLGPSGQHPTHPWLQTPEPSRSWGSTGKSGFKRTFLFGRWALSKGGCRPGADRGWGWRELAWAA